MSTFVEDTNGVIYGPGYLPPSKYYFYFSSPLSGQKVQEYSFPGTWGSAWQTLVVPPNKLYDIVGFPSGNSTVYGLGQIAETGRITILHQFSSSDGFPIGSNIALGADGNIYGVGAQTPQSAPSFIFRFTPSGAYSRS
jgi:hypothetical protein